MICFVVNRTSGICIVILKSCAFVFGLLIVVTIINLFILLLFNLKSVAFGLFFF